MILLRLLLVAVLSLSFTTARAVSHVTVVSSGSLINLEGIRVGQVSIEQQGAQVYLHVTGAARAAGATLEVLVSDSQRSLQAGDHTGPGLRAIRAGRIERGEVRYLLPPSVEASNPQSVWIWCRSVRLPSARATLKLNGL